MELHTTLRHALWAVVISVTVLGSVYLATGHGRQPIGPPTVADSATQGLARTVQSTLDAVRLLQTARNAPTALEQPIINVLPKIEGISAGAELQWTKALGHERTVTVYSAAYRPPTPFPIPTLAPGDLPANYEAWHHADTLAATEEALKATPVELHVDQQAVGPSRIGAVYTIDGSAGAVYALARRKSLDFDIGAVTGKNETAALAGFGLNLGRSDAGVFVGAKLGKSPISVTPAFGFEAGLVIHT